MISRRLPLLAAFVLTTFPLLGQAPGSPAPAGTPPVATRLSDGTLVQTVWIEPIYMVVYDARGEPHRILVQEGHYKRIEIPPGTVPTGVPAVVAPSAVAVPECPPKPTPAPAPSGMPSGVGAPGTSPAIPNPPPSTIAPTAGIAAAAPVATVAARGFGILNRQRFQLQIDSVTVTRADGAFVDVLLPDDRTIASGQEMPLQLPGDSLAVTIRFKEWDWGNKRFRLPVLAAAWDLRSGPAITIF